MRTSGGLLAWARGFIGPPWSFRPPGFSKSTSSVSQLGGHHELPADPDRRPRLVRPQGPGAELLQAVQAVFEAGLVSGQEGPGDHGPPDRIVEARLGPGLVARGSDREAPGAVWDRQEEHDRIGRAR